MTEPLLLTQTEVARRLGIGRATLDRLMRRGELPYVLVGGRAGGPGDRRLVWSDVEDWVRRSKIAEPQR